MDLVFNWVFDVAKKKGYQKLLGEYLPKSVYSLATVMEFAAEKTTFISLAEPLEPGMWYVGAVQIEALSGSPDVATKALDSTGLKAIAETVQNVFPGYVTHLISVYMGKANNRDFYRIAFAYYHGKELATGIQLGEVGRLCETIANAAITRLRTAAGIMAKVDFTRPDVVVAMVNIPLSPITEERVPGLIVEEEEREKEPKKWYEDPTKIAIALGILALLIVLLRK